MMLSENSLVLSRYWKPKFSEAEERAAKIEMKLMNQDSDEVITDFFEAMHSLEAKFAKKDGKKT